MRRNAKGQGTPCTLAGEQAYAGNGRAFFALSGFSRQAPYSFMGRVPRRDRSDTRRTRLLPRMHHAPNVRLGHGICLQLARGLDGVRRDMTDVCAGKKLAARVAEQYRHSGRQQVSGEFVRCAAGVTNIAHQDDVERDQVVADRIGGVDGDPVGHTIERRIQTASEGRQRIDVLRRDLSSASKRGGDGDDAAAAADIQHIRSGNNLRMIEHVTSERLATHPCECPERGIDAVPVEIRLGRMPKRRDLGRQVQTYLWE